jgi:hypothetical protein
MPQAMNVVKGRFLAFFSKARLRVSDIKYSPKHEKLKKSEDYIIS